MARFVVVVFISLMVFATLMVTNVEGRRLLVSSSLQKSDNKEDSSSIGSFASLILSALPKGAVPSSTPSKKGHATLENEKLFARHLASIDRILRSVPSPGVGH